MKYIKALYNVFKNIIIKSKGEIFFYASFLLKFIFYVFLLIIIMAIFFVNIMLIIESVNKIFDIDIDKIKNIESCKKQDFDFILLCRCYNYKYDIYNTIVLYTIYSIIIKKIIADDNFAMILLAQIFNFICIFLDNSIIHKILYLVHICMLFKIIYEIKNNNHNLMKILIYDIKNLFDPEFFIIMFAIFFSLLITFTIVFTIILSVEYDKKILNCEKNKNNFDFTCWIVMNSIIFKIWFVVISTIISIIIKKKIYDEDNDISISIYKEKNKISILFNIIACLFLIAIPFIKIRFVEYFDVVLYIYHCVFSIFGLYNKWKFTLKYEFDNEIAKMEEGEFMIVSKREN